MKISEIFSRGYGGCGGGYGGYGGGYGYRSYGYRSYGYSGYRGYYNRSLISLRVL